MNDTAVAFRYFVALVGGGIIAAGLFLFMHSLISQQQEAKLNAQNVSLVNFVKVQKQETVRTKNYQKPPAPKKPKNPPPKEQIQVSKGSNVQRQNLNLNVNLSNVPFNAGGTGVYIGNGQASSGSGGGGGYSPLTPMVRVQPMYPPQAAIQGIQGEVNVCFTVEPDGSVSNPHVVSAKPRRGIFDNAAIQTILQWKFYPQKQNGKPVATKDVCQDIKFVLHNGNG